MAIGHFSVAIIGRSGGQSSVHAAAYAARERLTDARTGTVYNYARKGAEVVSSWVWLPKDAPEHLRDRAALWNGVEAAETRKNSQLARRIILALPHELTPGQQQGMLKDFVRENFTRKGLAADVSIHKPHAFGDQRNDHAHILIPTRFLDQDGIGKKDRESNSRDMLQVWRDQWEKTVNRHLERHGHQERISMKSLAAQGIERMPQIHLGQGATALLRKGIDTDRADELREIANDNGLTATEPEASPAAPEPEFIDRDQHETEWQEQIVAAAIAAAEHRRREFIREQQQACHALQQEGAAMGARHAGAWNDLVQRQHEHSAGFDAAPVVEAVESTVSGLSSLLSFFAGIADGFASLATGSSRKRSTVPDTGKRREREERERRQREQQEQDRREAEALNVQQAAERAQWERRMATLKHEQARALLYFEQSQETSTFRQAFETRAAFNQTPPPPAEPSAKQPDDPYRQTLADLAEQKTARQERERERGFDLDR